MVKRSLSIILLVVAGGALSLQLTIGNEAKIAEAEQVNAWQRVDLSDGDLRVVVVPGHTVAHPGARFGDYTELDLNNNLAMLLVDMVNGDPRMSAMSTHKSDGSIATWFENYMGDNKDEITRFVKDNKRTYSRLFSHGYIHNEQSIDHNYAPEESVLLLYAVNKFANDYDVDVVIHIHFNDVSDREINQIGRYRGYSIYIPERQLPNYSESYQIARELDKRLGKVSRPSDNPVEGSTIMQDQELIAIGAYGSREGASLLAEYAYVYEPMLRDRATRENYLKELALQTYLALRSYRYR